MLELYKAANEYADKLFSGNTALKLMVVELFVKGAVFQAERDAKLIAGEKDGLLSCTELAEIIRASAKERV